MPDPTISDALAEVYASAPHDEVVYSTLEIWHPAFTDPIRVVNDKRALDACIEAPRATRARWSPSPPGASR